MMIAHSQETSEYQQNSDRLFNVNFFFGIALREKKKRLKLTRNLQMEVYLNAVLQEYASSRTILFIKVNYYRRRAI